MLSEKAREGKKLYMRDWRKRNKKKEAESLNKFYEKKYDELKAEEAQQQK